MKLVRRIEYPAVFCGGDREDLAQVVTFGQRQNEIRMGHGSLCGEGGHKHWRQDLLLQWRKSNEARVGWRWRWSWRWSGEDWQGIGGIGGKENQNPGGFPHDKDIRCHP
jgi:hypothetical protein